MKNVTITVEDATLEWVRIEAAKRNTSVSRLVGEMLTDKMQHDDAYARALREWVADTSSFSSGGAPYPEREAGFAAGPSQGETLPLGGQRPTRSGGAWGAAPAAGPSQGETAPSGAATRVAERGGSGNHG